MQQAHQRLEQRAASACLVFAAQAHQCALGEQHRETGVELSLGGGRGVGQPVRITNSDQTLHNVHTLPKQNVETNFSQPKNTPAVTKTFTKVEIGVSVRCDVHGWMNGWVGVVDHPFFAVSAADGTFEIQGLPAGSYTLEAWHEVLGSGRPPGETRC